MNQIDIFSIGMSYIPCTASHVDICQLLTHENNIEKNLIVNDSIYKKNTSRSPTKKSPLIHLQTVKKPLENYNKSYRVPAVQPINNNNNNNVDKNSSNISNTQENIQNKTNSKQKSKIRSKTQQTTSIQHTHSSYKKKKEAEMQKINQILNFQQKESNRAIFNQPKQSQSNQLPNIQFNQISKSKSQNKIKNPKEQIKSIQSSIYEKGVKQPFKSGKFSQPPQTVFLHRPCCYQDQPQQLKIPRISPDKIYKTPSKNSIQATRSLQQINSNIMHLSNKKTTAFNTGIDSTQQSKYPSNNYDFPQKNKIQQRPLTNQLDSRNINQMVSRVKSQHLQKRSMGNQDFNRFNNNYSEYQKDIQQYPYSDLKSNRDFSGNNDQNITLHNHHYYHHHHYGNNSQNSNNKLDRIYNNHPNQYLNSTGKSYLQTDTDDNTPIKITMWHSKKNPYSTSKQWAKNALDIKKQSLQNAKNGKQRSLTQNIDDFDNNFERQKEEYVYVKDNNQETNLSVKGQRPYNKSLNNFNKNYTQQDFQQQQLQIEQQKLLQQRQQQQNIIYEDSNSQQQQEYEQQFEQQILDQSFYKDQNNNNSQIRQNNMFNNQSINKGNNQNNNQASNNNSQLSQIQNQQQSQNNNSDNRSQVQQYSQIKDYEEFQKENQEQFNQENEIDLNELENQTIKQIQANQKLKNSQTSFKSNYSNNTNKNLNRTIKKYSNNVNSGQNSNLNTQTQQKTLHKNNFNNNKNPNFQNVDSNQNSYEQEEYEIEDIQSQQSYIQQDNVQEEVEIIDEINGTNLEKRPKGIPQEVRNFLKDNVTVQDQNKAAQYNTIVQQLTPSNMYQQMDSTFDGFFQKRDYTIKNFNFLIKILGEQRKYDQTKEVLEKMQFMKVKPNPVTYNYLINAAGKSQKVEEAEELFSKSVAKFGYNKMTYNSLLTVYVKTHNHIEVDRIFREMQRNEIIPDIPIYTSVINTHFKAKNIDKCWEIYDSLVENQKKTKLIPDTNLKTLMIKICAHTHDAEKAIKINQELESQSDFMHTTTTYNSIIKALGSRRDYAEQALEYYEKMKIEDVIMDTDTYVHTLKACSNAGDVNTAFNILQEMKNQKIKPNKYTYNELLRTYAGACRHFPITEESKDMYIKDAWVLFEQIKQLGFLNTNTLNSFLYIFVKAQRPEELEGMVLPLYEKFGIEKDQYTYQHILEIFHEHRDLKTIYNLYTNMQKENLQSTWWSLNYVLDAAIRAEDIDVIIEILRKFQKIKREPKIIYLKRLGEADYVPDNLYAELNKFSKKFGHLNKKYGHKNKKLKKPVRDAWR